ncbi:MAG: beta-ketoacyl-[Victivallales bacterium]|nr:beta-ketoacyl-[acyl-carrier-protein] synthase family protein [Victivallales bacterium]
MKKRIVITGAGVTSALGNTRQDLFEALLAGRTAVHPMPEWRERMQNATSVVAAPVDLPEATAKTISRHYRRSMGPAALYAALAAKSAVAESGLTPEQLGNGRTGCIASSSLGSSTEIEAVARAIFLGGNFFDLPACQFFKMVSHSSAFNVANLMGINGVQLSPCSACASSLQSVGLAYEQLLLGKQDAFLAGGSDEATPIVLDSFRLLHALAEDKDMTPEQMSRPFDARRSGLVCGDGAAILAVETLEHAQARGARPMAEILGYATNCTGAQISQSDSASIRRCIEMALEDAGIAPQDVDYVSAHATGTPNGDSEEAKAIFAVFGDKTPVSSLKGQLGHTLGASGALELTVILEMMQRGIILPNHNLEQIADDCIGPDFVREPRQGKVNVVLKNCIAFGGVNVSLVLGKID